MHDVDVCAQQSSNAGVELNIPVWGGYLPTMAVEIFFLWTTLSPVRPESAVCIADYWGTDGNNQRKWTMFLVHPTNSASAILSKRNNKHRLKSEFIALNLRLHLLWHSCANFFSCLINVNKIYQNFPCIQCHVTAVGSQQNRVFVFMWFKVAMSFAESWKSLTLKLSFMCWGRTDFGITPVEKDSTYI